MKTTTNSPYEKLAEAIVMQAAMDYRDAVSYKLKYKNLNRKEYNEETNRLILLKSQTTDKSERKKIDKQIVKREKFIEKLYAADYDEHDCKKFFLSEWFTHLSDVDGEVLLEKLNFELGI